MLFQSDFLKSTAREHVPEFAENYYRASSFIIAVVIFVTAALVIAILLLLSSAYRLNQDTKSLGNELVTLESRLQQQSMKIDTVDNEGGSSSQLDMRVYIAEQEKKIRELEPLMGGQVSALGALTAIEKSIPENILLSRLEYSFSASELIIYILTVEPNGVEEMVTELEALGVGESVAIVKKERLRNQELYYEVEMQL